MTGMRTIILKQLEIFYSIIFSIVVDVVDHLIGREISPQEFFHDDSVFEYFSAPSGIRMAQNRYCNIRTSHLSHHYNHLLKRTQV